MKRFLSLLTALLMALTVLPVAALSAAPTVAPEVGWAGSGSSTTPLTTLRQTDPVTQTETLTPTQTLTPSQTVTATETVTATQTVTPTETVTATGTVTATETISPTEMMTSTEMLTPTTVVVTESEDLRMVTVAGEGQLRIRIEVEQTDMQMNGVGQPDQPGSLPGTEPITGTQPSGTETMTGTQTGEGMIMPGVQTTETEDGSIVQVQSTGRVHIAIDVEPMAGGAGAGTQPQPTQTPAAEDETEIELTPAAPETSAVDVEPVPVDTGMGGVIEFSQLEGFNVVNTNGEDVGSIGDLVVNIQTGEILVAAVEFGGFLGLGTQVLPIPWQSLRWDPDFFALISDLPADLLDDPPGLDGDWPNLNDQIWVDEAEATWQALGIEGPSENLRSMSSQLASVETLFDYDVRTNDGEDIGSFEEVLVDMGTGQILYAILTSGGFLGLGADRYAIPLEALSFEVAGEDGAAVVNMSSTQIEAAPQYDVDLLTADANWDLGTREFWGVGPRATEPNTEQPIAPAQQTTPTPVSPTVEATTTLTSTEELTPSETITATEAMTETDALTPSETITETEAMTETGALTPSETITETEAMTGTGSMAPMGIEISQEGNMHVILLSVDGPFHIQLNVRTGSGMTTETDVSGLTPDGQGQQSDAGQTDTAQAEGEPTGSLNMAEDPVYGDYLTDTEGRTLYTYTGSEDGFFVGEGWEAVTASDDDAPGAGVDAELMGEVERDGIRYRTYADRPLYRYSGDAEPGTITGQGMDESWWAVSPTGEAIQTE